MDMQKMMQQAQEMQEKMQEMQNKLGEIEVQGTAGGGMVTVTCSCKGECKKVSIEPEALQEKEMLEDLIAAAYNDAKAKADAKMAEETQSMMQDMGLPAGVQLPF